MTAHARAVCLVFAVSVLAVPVAGADLEKKEAATIAKVSKELLKLAKTCIRGKDYPKAREHLNRGLGLDPENEKLQKELDEPEPHKPVPGDPELRKKRNNQRRR